MAWSIFTQGGGPEVAVGWATQFLKKIGAPVTPGNIEFVYQWEKSEGGGGKFNPLNQGVVQGHPELTTSGTQYGGGAADYASWDAGLQGAYYYLHYSNYKNVLSNLVNNNPAAARQALWASPWAESHYGYGSNWYFGTIPNGTAILPGSDSSGSGEASTGDGTDATTTAAENCAWNLKFPVAGSTCVLTNREARVLLSLTLMGMAVFIGLWGTIVLVGYSLKGTIGQNASTAASLIPGGSLATKAISRGVRTRSSTGAAGSTGESE